VGSVVEDYRTLRVVRRVASRLGAASVQPGRGVTAAAMSVSLSGVYQAGVKP
jgi:hypothetical protein